MVSVSEFKINNSLSQSQLNYFEKKDNKKKIKQLIIILILDNPIE